MTTNIFSDVTVAETHGNRTRAAIGMITIWVCQQSVSSEVPAIVLADTGSLKDSSATTKSGSATKRYRC
jgi:hypothetical protein